MSRDAATSVKEDLIQLLRRPPRASAIQSIQQSQRFRSVHAAATKYVKSGRSSVMELNGHLNTLKQFY